MNEILLDDPKPMSKSRLWDLQKDAYTQFGIEAWGKHRVPFYITSNCFTAKSYAYVALGYIRDIVAQGMVDQQKPIYIIDLGAGTGRFGYFFLVELMRFIETSSLSHLKIRYVLTDISEDNMAFWQRHPLMKPFFEKGILDFAYFEHSQKEPLHLRISNEVLSKENVVNPMILIANYFFDTIPHDLFRVQNGVLEEGKVTLKARHSEEVSVENMAPTDPAIISHLQCHYTYAPLKDAHYYADPRLNAVLESYTKDLQNATFLFPVGGFQTICNFVDHSSGRMLLLSGDHGASSDEQLQEGGEPQLAVHGSFSFGVNFNAILRFFQQSNGITFSSFSDTVFGVIAGVLGNQGSYPELKLAFQEHMLHFEPRDYWKLVSQAEEKWKTPTMEHMIIVLKLGNSDSMSFQAFFNRIREVLPSASDRQKDQLLQLIMRTLVYFYPVNEESGNFILNMGVLLYDLHHYKESLHFFKYAQEISGSNATVLKNQAICYRVLGDEATALALEAQAATLPELT